MRNLPHDCKLTLAFVAAAAALMWSWLGGVLT